MSLLGAASGCGLLRGGGGKGGLPLIIGLCGGLTPCIVLDILLGGPGRLGLIRTGPRRG